MNNFDKKLLDILRDLRQNHSVVSVKTEFETEGTSFFEAKKLKQIVDFADLDFTIKIGGCGALNDVINAKKIGVNSIVAPMIESAYSLEKFIQTIKCVYSVEELYSLNLFINIETVTGVENIHKILNSTSFDYISGIILGRNDLVSSMNKDKNSVNNDEILDIIMLLASQLEKRNKNLIIGGCVDENSIDFFNKITSSAFIGFETRKIVFQKTESIKRESILKAIDFEINWLKSKEEINDIDKKRINYLEKFFVK